jgi:hypothetical protein
MLRVDSIGLALLVMMISKRRILSLSVADNGGVLIQGISLGLVPTFDLTIVVFILRSLIHHKYRYDAIRLSFPFYSYIFGRVFLRFKCLLLGINPLTVMQQDSGKALRVSWSWGQGRVATKERAD